MEKEKFTHVAIPLRLFNGIVSYLRQRPFEEVAEAIDELSKCPTIVLKKNEEEE